MSDNKCECGLDHDQEMIVTLYLDDNEEVDCTPLHIFEVDGKSYIALLPIEEDEQDEDGDVFIYRYSEKENGEAVLDNIEDDDEYEAAADAFDEWLDTLEFEELEGEEE